MKKKLIAALLIVLGFTLGGYAYLGGFYTIHIEESSLPEMRLVVHPYRGPYQGLGDAWQAFTQELTENGLESCDGVAFYLDEPSVPDSEKRSVLACRIDGLSPSLQSEVIRKFPSIVVPPLSVFESIFPYRNMLSFMIGPMRVYPKLMDSMKEKGLQPMLAVELYGDLEEKPQIRIALSYGMTSGPAMSSLERLFQSR